MSIESESAERIDASIDAMTFLAEIGIKDQISDAFAMQSIYEDAIQHEAIMLDSGSRYCLYREAKAVALEKLGRADEARQYFDEANRIKQDGGWE